MQKIQLWIEWLNAVPGRKRGIAAALLALSAILRVYGQAELAGTAEAANEVIQTYIVPGADVLGVILALVALVNAKKKGTL